METVKLVWLGQQKVEESNDGTFEFGSLISSDSDWRETFPENLFANVGGDEKGNTGTESIAFLEELIKHEYHESSNEKLEDNQNGVDETKFTDWAVHS